MAEEKTVYSPMILKMERICRGYIDQLEKPDGKEMNFQNFMMMYIFGSCNNTEYRTKLFDHWPTVRISKTIRQLKVIIVSSHVVFGRFFRRSWEKNYGLSLSRLLGGIFPPM